MKKCLFAALVIVSTAVMPACQKGIWGPDSLQNLYSLWPVHDNIHIQIVGLGGIASRDVMQAAGTGEYIDFSTKGIIVFHIKGLEHTDTYDATRYDLLKGDTPVNVDAAAAQHVSIKVISKSSFVLTEVVNSSELLSTTTYLLSK